MSTALATLNGSTELTDVERAILAELEGENHAFEFQAERIKMPAGGMLAFSTASGQVLQPPFTAVVAISQMVRAYWPGDAGLGLPPLCSSPDGSQGWLNGSIESTQLQQAIVAPVQHPGLDGTELGPFACRSCPLAQWGSVGDGGRGQACKSMRRLLILIDGWAMPAILTLPPTSVKPWDGYCSGLRSRRSAYFATRTRFSLEKATNAGGITFAVVRVEAAGAITDMAQLAAVTQIRREFAELVRSMPVDAAEYVDAEASAAAEVGGGDLPPF